MAKFIKIGERIIDAERIREVGPIDTTGRCRGFAIESGETHVAWSDNGPIFMTATEYADFARQVLGEDSDPCNNSRFPLADGDALVNHVDDQGRILSVIDLGTGKLRFMTTNEYESTAPVLTKVGVTGLIEILQEWNSRS